MKLLICFPLALSYTDVVSVKPLYRFAMSLMALLALACTDFTKGTLQKSRIKDEQSTDHVLHFSYS